MCSLSLVPVLVGTHKIILFIHLCFDLYGSGCSKCSCVQELRGALLNVLTVQLHIPLGAIWCIPEAGGENLF